MDAVADFQQMNYGINQLMYSDRINQRRLCRVRFHRRMGYSSRYQKRWRERVETDQNSKKGHGIPTLDLCMEHY